MKQHRTFVVFLIIWLIINVVTAVWVELYDDEAYYWMYAQYLDWGYFDHPPGIAVAIKMGAFLGKTELAVRLVNLFFTAVSITLIYGITKPKNVWVFCLTIFSFLVLHIIGFVALPDGPFFLAAILFLLAYRAFLATDSPKNTLLLGLAAAAMIYCKYHGFVVVAFTLASNLPLFKNYKTYLVAVVALVCISPHIYWQFTNDFPSLSYHLADRAAPEYRAAQTLDYLFGNLPFLGGLVAVALFVASAVYSPKNKWEKALKWNLFGMFIFFFLITFKGQFIEANWTLFCVFPMIVLGYQYIEASRYFVAFKYVSVVFAVILLVFRVHLLAPLTIIKKDRIWDFYGGKTFAQTVKKTAAGRKIVANRYQDASILNFYLNETYVIPAVNLNARASQYSIWQFEKALCGQNVAFVNDQAEGGTEIETKKFGTTKVALQDKATFPNCKE